MSARALATVIAACSFALTGCSTTAEERLQRRIDALLPEQARQSGDCDWASGFVENAPASLTCRYLVDGQVKAVDAIVRENLRAQGYGLHSRARARGAPTVRLFSARREDYVASIGLVAPGDPLDWQLDTTPVPAGSVGIFVALTERG